MKARGALAPNWEDPVRVSQALGNGAYKLETLDGELIPRIWNADNLPSFMSECDVRESHDVINENRNSDISFCVFNLLYRISNSLFG